MSNRPQLLIAEDDRVLVETMRDVLAEDFSVATAADGSEALARALELRPDVVVVDAKMPKVDGFQACRMLRDQPAMADIPIIMVTGRTGQAAAARAFAAGASDYITKPFSLSQLRARARTWLMRCHETSRRGDFQVGPGLDRRAR